MRHKTAPAQAKVPASSIIRVAADIGGTFTDVVIEVDSQKTYYVKVPSTPDDYSLAVIDGVRKIAARHDLELPNICELNHATTVATNAILEGKGARCALITTQGFRDVIELRRLRIPTMYDFQYEKPPELVRRAHRFEVSERTAADGRILRALDIEEVRQVCRSIKANRMEAVAISLLNSYRNPQNEKLILQIASEELGSEIYISVSSDVLPEIREYERTSTTVVNAYTGPVVKGYLTSLLERTQAAGIPAHINIMQSGGGVSSIETVCRFPASMVESGPAAGVIAAAEMARVCGLSRAIAFDMGGTTAKASMIEDFTPVRTTEYEVGSGISISSQLVKGGGYPIKMPFIDVSEIGAGGGSIITVDPVSKSLRVGPESAGSKPGPACYEQGGDAPTLTDALVVLGYLNPSELVSGALPLNATLARKVLEREVAQPLGLSLFEAARGAFEVAVATMTRAVKAVSTYRGRDPRDFTLVAFGGNGPVFATGLSDALNIRRVIVPPKPGLFSAVGLLVALPQRELVRSLYTPLENLSPSEIKGALDAMAREAMVELKSEDRNSEVSIEWFADLKYRGQAYELTIALEDDAGLQIDSIKTSFHAEHRKTYGHSSPFDPVDLVNLRVRASAMEEKRRAIVDALGDTEEFFAPKLDGSRQVVFDSEMIETEVVSRGVLGSQPRSGPLIIEEYDSTVVVPSDWLVSLDVLGNIEITK